MFAIIKLMPREAEDNMVIFDLDVVKQQIFGAEKVALAANANKTIFLRFHFDGSWRILDSRAAIFRTADNKFYIIEAKHCSVQVPWEVLTFDNDVELSVVGFDGSTVLTTGKVTLPVTSSLLPEDCKTLSPSETLFDRFRSECMEAVYKNVKDETEAMKRSYEEKIAELGAKINKANENTANVEKQKNDEIEKLKQDNAVQVNSLSRELAETKSQLAAMTVKADKWDLIDNAVSDKTLSTSTLWNGSSKEYRLPFLNTQNVMSFSTDDFDLYVSEIGLSLASAMTFDQIFQKHQRLKKAELADTEYCFSFEEAFSACTSLREVKIGDLTICESISQAFFNDTSLEKVTLGYNESIQNFSQAFYGCKALREINGELNFIVARDNGDMFTKCSSLEKVDFTPETIRMDMSLQDCVALSKESMMSLFNGLCNDVKKTVKVSKYAFDNNFPTDAEKNEVTNLVTKTKGWKLITE